MPTPRATTSSTSMIIPVSSRAALVEAARDDVFVRCSAPLDERLTGWATAGGVAWTSTHRRRGARWLTVVAADAVAPQLVHAAAEAFGAELAGLTVPSGAIDQLPTELRPPAYNLWDWFSTTMPPSPQPGEDAVEWSTPADDAALVTLIDQNSPRHSARPGDADVLRWCVVRDAERPGELLACAALTEHLPGIAHLASIVTRTDQRGRGLGRAVTAWITRALLAEGSPIVTLGMYSDNDVARRLYRSLGYVEAHQFASGWLAGRAPQRQTDHH